MHLSCVHLNVGEAIIRTRTFFTRPFRCQAIGLDRIKEDDCTFFFFTLAMASGQNMGVVANVGLIALKRGPQSAQRFTGFLALVRFLPLSFLFKTFERGYIAL